MSFELGFEKKKSMNLPKQKIGFQKQKKENTGMPCITTHTLLPK